MNANELVTSIKLLIWIAVAAAVITFLDRADHTLLALEHASVQAQKTLADTQKQIDLTSRNLNDTLVQVKATANQLREASYEQREYWTKAAYESDKTVRALRQFIDRTDRGINDGFLPAATQAVHHGDDELVAVGRDTEASLHASNQAIAQLSATLASVAPQLQNSAAHIDATTAHLAAATADIQTRVHDLTRPKKWYMKVAGTLLSAASSVGSILGGLL